MSTDIARKLQVGAYFMLAGGFVLSAAAAIKTGSNGNVQGLGQAGTLPSPPRGPARLPQGQRAQRQLQSPKTKQYDIENIDDRVALIGDLIRKGSLNSELREKTLAILSTKCDRLGRVQRGATGETYCVPEKDCLAEVKAMFEVVRNPRSKYSVRYTRDALLADVFTAPERTLLKTHAGDCDDYCILLGAMLMATGHPVRLRILATRRPGIDDRIAPWSHIYLLTPTKFDDPRAKWIAVDASMDKPLSWEAPGAREVAATGKPAGIVARVRDYNVVKPNEVA
jgi:hypothetical protein